MDLVGLATIVAAVGGLVFSVVGYLREREKLRTLERVVGIMEKMDPQSRSWKALKAVQEDLVLNVFREYVGRVAQKSSQGPANFLAAIFIFLAAAATIAAGIATQVASGLDTQLGLPFVLIGSGLLATGLVTLIRGIWGLRRERGRSSDEVDALFESAGFVRAEPTR